MQTLNGAGVKARQDHQRQQSLYPVQAACSENPGRQSLKEGLQCQMTQLNKRPPKASV